MLIFVIIAYIINIINFCIRNSNFDDGMKLGDIPPVHKKDDFTDKLPSYAFGLENLWEDYSTTN